MATLAVALGVHQWRVAVSLQDGLSPIANRYAESETIRAAESFATRGFTYAWGLSDYYYGNQFPNDGGKPSAPPAKKEYIYTHNPPAADWLAGIASLVFGVGNVGKFRAIPIALGVLGLLALALGLYRFFQNEPWRAVAAFAITVAFPMTYNMMHGLHHHGYATTLYLVQLGILLAVAANGFRVGHAQAAALAMLGFLQGWMSLDYFPLVAFSSVAFSIAWWHRRAPDTTWHEHVLIALLPLAGYILAFGMHFLQVAAHHGSVEAAFDDFARAGTFRSGVTEQQTRGFYSLQLLWQYLVQFLPRRRFFGTPLLELLAIFVILTIASRLWWQRPSRGAEPRRVHLNIRWSALFAVFAAFLVGASWVLVMTNHAWRHGNYIPRNFLLSYLLPVYLIIDGLEITWRSKG